MKYSRKQISNAGATLMSSNSPRKVEGAGKNEQVMRFENAPGFTKMTDQEFAVWYNDNVIYPDKVRLNCYYYRNYSFIKDIQMILCTVLGKKMKYAGEEI